MKNNYKITYLLLAVLFLFQYSATAQDILDVAPFNDEGDFNLVPTIWGDTSATGERKNLNRIYRLERGKTYVMDQTIFADYPIRFIADSDDESIRPPILIRGAYATGDNINTFFTFTADGLSHSFKDIIFNGVDLNNNYFDEWNKGLKVAGSDITLTFDGCIMNAWSGLFLEVVGDNGSLFIRNCKWRNGVGAQAPPWGAQQMVFNNTNHVDTVVMTNNTAFNTRGFIMDFEVGAVANYILVEHNTFFTGAIDMLRMRDMSNAEFRSNLFYGTHAYAQAESERKANWFDKDEEIISLFSIDTTDVALLSSIQLEEKDKNIVVSNNTYFFPQVLQDWWAENPALNTPVWMNDRTKSMFSNDAAYPSLEAFDNTVEDPQFDDTAMDTWIIGELVNYCKNVRFNNSIVSANYDKQTGTENLRLLPWPLPESLVYSNASMLVGGHDGLPVGDLNWYPEKKDEWASSVKELDNNIPFAISPNPASDICQMHSDTPVQEISIYNTVGQLVSSRSVSGQDVAIDVSNLKNGLYFIKIKTAKGIGTKSFVKE